VEVERKTAVELLLARAGLVLMIVFGTGRPGDGPGTPIVAIANAGPDEQFVFSAKRSIWL
jgi:hypothetical protein